MGEITENGRTITKEIRFAVVMYGGISLAIYMNGIAQELLSLVRATADNPPRDESKTVGVYRKLRDELAESSRTEGGDGFDVKFVVDILSGTSAGGINAVCLAKALTRGSRNLGPLEGMWLVEGDIDTLLNDTKSNPLAYPSRHPKTSLLNSQRMYAKLLEAFRKTEENRKDPPLVKDLDLFVTATDLRGVNVPIRINDGVVHERMHKHVFHFAFRAPDEVAETDGEEPDESPAEGENCFTADYDPMLAFASRCTSSFPAAFEPAKLKDIGRQPKKPEKGKRSDVVETWFEKFFHPYRETESAKDTKERLFADGGYLDNYPFGHAIEAINERHASCPVDRKLLFIDPFAKDVDPEKDAAGDIGFLENVRLAAMTLPRYETIREDIADVKRRNRWLLRVKILMDQVESRIQGSTEDVKFNRNLKEKSYDKCDLEEMAEVYGEAYVSYHYAKVYGVTDDLARMITRAAPGLDERSDHPRAIRHILMAWRKDEYCSYRKDAERDDGDERKPRRSENEFLATFDMGFRLRRLTHLCRLIENTLSAADPRPVPDLLAGERGSSEQEKAYLARLHHAIGIALDSTYSVMRSLLSNGDGNPLRTPVRRLMEESDGFREQLDRVLATSGEDAFRREASEVYGIHAHDFKPIIEAIQEVIEAERGFMNRTVRKAIFDSEGARDMGYRVYDHYEYGYDLRDSLTFPLFAGGRFAEGNEVDVYRVSPLDATNLWSQPTTGEDGSGSKPEQDDGEKKKLAGVAVGAFGGFLEREWRRNDIMWGRLDGAERIISALLPGEDPDGIRQGFIDDAQNAILAESLEGTDYVREEEGRSAPIDLSKPGWKEQFRDRYECDMGLDAPSNLKRLGRASRILSSMVEGLQVNEGSLPRTKGILKWTGTFLLWMVDLTTPRSFLEVLFVHWLKLLCLVSVVLTLAGFLFKPFENLASPGLTLMAVVVVAWIAKKILQSWIHLGRRPTWVLQILIGLIVLAVVVVLLTVIPSFRSFWDLFVEKLGEGWGGVWS